MNTQEQTIELENVGIETMEQLLMKINNGEWPEWPPNIPEWPHWLPDMYIHVHCLVKDKTFFDAVCEHREKIDPGHEYGHFPMEEVRDYYLTECGIFIEELADDLKLIIDSFKSGECKYIAPGTATLTEDGQGHRKEKTEKENPLTV